MVVITHRHRLRTVEQVEQFLHRDHTTLPLRFQTRAETYRFLERTVRRFDYFHLGRADKGVLRRFLGKVTGLSRAQITRLLNQYHATGQLADHRHASPRAFRRRYTNADIELLAEVDALHGSLSGPTTRKLCTRAYHLFGDCRFERLAGISNGHLYNLRVTIAYRRRRQALSDPMWPVPLASRERWRPRLFGLPGHLRVLAVQQGDREGLGGLHRLNLVDEITRFQFVGAVERLDAACLAPVLDGLLHTFPFTVRGFHATRFSGGVNRRVAALLCELHAEGRAGSGAVRGNDGHLAAPGDGRFPNRYAAQVNAFIRQMLSSYLNYHRLCCFPADRVDATGRLHRHCRDADIVTPYERLRSLPEARACLKPGTTFTQLDALASAMSDNEAARAVGEAGARLLRSVG